MKRVLFLLFLVIYSNFLFAQSRGYELSIDAAAGLGVTNLSKYSAGVSIINGYRISEKFAVSLGVGFKYAETLYYYSDDNTLGDYESRDNKYLVPVFLQVKFNLTNGSIAPFIVGDVGYTFDLGRNQNKNLEALFVEPIIGVDFKSKSTTWFVGIGANVQQHHYEHFHISDVIKSSERTIRGFAPTLNLHFGVAF